MASQPGCPACGVIVAGICTKVAPGVDCSQVVDDGGVGGGCGQQCNSGLDCCNGFFCAYNGYISPAPGVKVCGCYGLSGTGDSTLPNNGCCLGLTFKTLGNTTGCFP